MTTTPAPPLPPGSRSRNPRSTPAHPHAAPRTPLGRLVRWTGGSARRWARRGVERCWRPALAAVIGVAVAGLFASPSLASWAKGSCTAGQQADLDRINQILSNLRWWMLGVLAGLATVFLTVGAVRYLLAGGEPGELERAKLTMKSAAVGYGLAVLTPLALSILQSVVGNSPSC
jgi:hypothetical protein